MGYLHIDNLYKAQEILLFRRCYALEKIHGTSAHIRWKREEVGFFSGGSSHEQFISLFDTSSLTECFQTILQGESVVVYGEAYGGKCQAMSPTYGKELRFIVFDVKVNDVWVNVPNAHDIATKLGLSFVPYEEVSTDIDSLNAERDRESVQASRNGIGQGKMWEGVVLRPLIEVTLNNGNRVIAKHKRAEFAERGRPDVPLDPTKRELLASAEAIATEWVTPMRLQHVLDAVASQRGGEQVWDIVDTGTVIKAMVEDVCREAEGEMVDSKAVRRAIGARGASLYKRWLAETLVTSIADTAQRRLL